MKISHYLAAAAMTAFVLTALGPQGASAQGYKVQPAMRGRVPAVTQSRLPISSLAGTYYCTRGCAKGTPRLVLDERGNATLGSVSGIVQPTGSQRDVTVTCSATVTGGKCTGTVGLTWKFGKLVTIPSPSPTYPGNSWGKAHPWELQVTTQGSSVAFSYETRQGVIIWTKR
jgi:hypothetical protein